MSYIVPSVQVYQQLASTGGVLNSTPNLDTCIIGPANNVLKYVPGSTVSQVATAALSTSTTLGDMAVDLFTITNVVATGGFAVLDVITVIGAGAGGTNLQGTITGIAGNVITLDTAAQTAVTQATVSKVGKIVNTAVTNTFALPGQKPGQIITTSTITPWYSNAKVETALAGFYGWAQNSLVQDQTPTGVTGTITTATNSLTITSAAMATQWAVGDSISVANAAAGGVTPLVTIITNIVGTTFTLATAAGATATTQAVTNPGLANLNSTTNTLRAEVGDAINISYTPVGASSAVSFSSIIKSVVTSSGLNGNLVNFTLNDMLPDNMSTPTTTGTVGAASTTMTVAAGSIGFSTGDTVIVAGAGVAGAALQTTITVSGLTYTLAAPTTTAVTNTKITKVLASTAGILAGASTFTMIAGGITHFAIGDRVIISGADANGADLTATISNIAGSVVTFGPVTQTVTSGATAVRKVNNFQLSVRKTYNDQQVPATKPISGGSNFDITATGTTGNVLIQANSEIIYGKIITADVYFTYSALRTDLSGTVNEFSSIEDIEGLLGDVSDANPLALALQLSLANTTGRVFGVGIPSNDLTGHEVAMNLLENIRMYCLVPLTQDLSILEAYEAHCVQLSQPAEASWRIVLTNSAQPTTMNIGQYSVNFVNSNSGNNTVALQGSNYVLTSSNSTFISDGVVAGDVLNITTSAPGTGVGTHTVLNVVSNQQLVIQATGALTGVSLYVTRALTKAQQAAAVAATSSTFGEKRVVHVQPDLVGVSVNDTTTYLPGYYLCAALGGMVSGFPVQQGFTNIGVAGISDLKHSNFYYGREDLNTMAEKGTFLFVQQTQGGIPYVRHELTTDVSVLEYRELLKVKNWDFLSYFYFDKLSPFIGSWNITKDTLNTIRQTIVAASELLLSQKLPKIGPPLLSYQITSLVQDPNNQDNVNCNLKIAIVSPLNYLNLFLIV